MTTTQKFATAIPVLESAVLGDVNLDSEYPTLFKNVFKFYEGKGVDFYGDVEEDYAILIDNLYRDWETRSEEHTSELQSPEAISYAVFCLKKKNKGGNNGYTKTGSSLAGN